MNATDGLREEAEESWGADLPTPLQILRVRTTIDVESAATTTDHRLASELKLDSALAQLDRAASWEEVKAAKLRILELGSEAIPAALDTLRIPQPPDRVDALEDLIVRYWPLEYALEVDPKKEPVPFRQAWPGVIASYASLDDRALRVVAIELERLARDPEPSVRIAVAEALSRAGGSMAAKVLSGIAGDPNDGVASAARAALADLVD